MAFGLYSLLGMGVLVLVLCLLPTIHGATVKQTTPDNPTKGEVKPPPVNYPAQLCNFVEALNTGLCVEKQSCRTSSSSSTTRHEVLGTCEHKKFGEGDCCKRMHKCSSEHKDVVSYFTNEKYPEGQKDDIYCSSKIEVQKKVCQLRVDFIEFVLPQADANGVCHFQNNLKIKAPSKAGGLLGPGGNNVFCGTNTGSHLYIPVTVGDSVSLVVTLNGISPVDGFLPNASYRTTTDYKWNIKVTQIECSSTNDYFRELEAPANCLQYFTGQHGEITSFNNDGFSRIAPDQEYDVCIRATYGACSLTLRPIYFNMPVGGMDASIEECPSGAVGDYECCTDPQSASIRIPSTPSSPGRFSKTTRRYYCGKTFTEVLSTFKPFQMSVYVPYFEKQYGPTEISRGFHFQYLLNAGNC